MEKRKITVVVETGKDLFSCFMSGADDLGFSLIGDGTTVRKAMDDFMAAHDEMRDYYASTGKPFPELEFEFVLDVGAFLNYYPINVTAFAEYIGINASQLRRYASGLCQPSAKTIAKIRQGLDKVGHDIVGGRLVDRPVLQYV